MRRWGLALALLLAACGSSGPVRTAATTAADIVTIPQTTAPPSTLRPSEYLSHLLGLRDVTVAVVDSYDQDYLDPALRESLCNVFTTRVELLTAGDLVSLPAGRFRDAYAAVLADSVPAFQACKADPRAVPTGSTRAAITAAVAKLRDHDLNEAIAAGTA